MVQQNYPVGLGGTPSYCTCPHCHQMVNTRVRKEMKTSGYLFAVLCCLCG